MGMPGYYNSLETTKLDVANVTTTITRAGGSLVVDEYTGVTLNTYATGTTANYTFKLTPTSSIPVGGKIIIEFPSTYASLLGNAAVSTTCRLAAPPLPLLAVLPPPLRAMAAGDYIWWFPAQRSRPTTRLP